MAMYSSTHGNSSSLKAHAIVLLVFAFLATIAVALRFWARKLQQQVLSLNDYLIILGLIFALAETGLNVYGCCFPDGWKSSNQLQDITLGLQVAFVSPIVWVIAVTIIRASIISLYMHLFPTRSFRIACYGILVFNFIFMATTILADCFICRPISFKWDFTIRGSCGNDRSLALYIAIVNLFQDVIVVVLPMPILWGLQMARKKKVALSGIFGLGIVICAVTIYRVQESAFIGTPGSPATQRAYANIAVLTSLETLLGIITACLPIMKPIFKKLCNSIPKNGSKGAVTTTSASIPIVMRISHMFSSSARRHARSGYASSVSSSSCEEGMVERQKRRVSPEPKADRLLGIKVSEIYVRKDVEVESVQRESLAL